MNLYDAHVHLDFMQNAHDVARDAKNMGIRLFANTVTPEGFVRTSKLVGSLSNVDIGLGQHPWWIDQANMQLFDELLPTTNWVGEVGLDFSPKRAHHEEQLRVFSHIARSCAKLGNKTLSIHSVRAAATALDVLHDTGCTTSCRCIFHWFSGSTDDLWRAIREGCWFSVNERQASTRRATEQLRLIPEDRLLYETDFPPTQDEPFEVELIRDSLVRTKRLVRGIRERNNRG